jgi:hypothetical protein
MRITRLVIRNFRGIEALDVEVSPAGVIACGRNAAGKTTVLKAVRSALAANDIGEDAIRIGADRAEILVDLDALSVKRTITARAAADRARAMLAAIERAERSATNDEAVASASESQADELEAALAAAQPPAVSDAELEAVRTRVARAEQTMEGARAAAHARAAADAAVDRRERLADAQRDADILDGYVRALTNDAPATLLASSNGIAGLGIEGDEVTLDGKRLDALCGQEQMAFAVQIAKRLNEKAKLLVVDGLERLDPEQLDAFVREATRDGWQLLGTKVDRGGLVIEAIEAADEKEAAE